MTEAQGLPSGCTRGAALVGRYGILSSHRLGCTPKQLHEELLGSFEYLHNGKLSH